MTLDARSRLFVALDLPSVGEAEALVARLGDTVSHYKIGYQLGYAGGIDFGKSLIAAGKTVFFDLKLHDIDNTVQHGVASIAASGAQYLTVHAYPQTMRAAVAGAKGSQLKILAVTILTSWSEIDVAEAGYSGTTEGLVTAKARQATALGVGGIVCSAREASVLRRAGIPADIELVTPGIRPAGSAVGDQVRVVTPAEAIRNGADRLVVGRPITGASDPVSAAKAILAEIEAAKN